jgi:hypothetical protein
MLYGCFREVSVEVGGEGVGGLLLSVLVAGGDK